MEINDSVLEKSEKIIFALRELYTSFGYLPYRMSKFEEYDLYASNKDFLVSDNVITFTDTDGKLMALKPDVTLSIIKSCPDTPKETKKVFYNENVYRVSKSTDSFKEIMQAGVECFGKVEGEEICEMITLAAKSLKLLSSSAVLSLSDLDIIAEIIKDSSLPADKEQAVYSAVNEKNIPEIDKIFEECDLKENSEILKSLINLQGNAKEILPRLKIILSKSYKKAYNRFYGVIKTLSETDISDMLQIDFSVTGDANYYNGIFFKGFIKDIPTAVLSGGQYDRLMNKLGRKSCAIGFAVYTDLLERIDLSEKSNTSEDDGYINIALPKGRLGEKIYNLFDAAGFECPSLLDPGRKLIFENEEKKVRYFWVKPSDVAIYVEHGAADIGVAGKDILLEYEPDVYELLDLKKGKCRMAVAALKSYKDDPQKTLKVATKFSNIAKNYYRSIGRDIDIIHLNGSIEIAPILGLSDVIVDIVETGKTLKENNLEVFETVVPISARLIANKASFKFKYKKIEEIKNGLSVVTED